MPGPYVVRTQASIGTTPTTGDGKGKENRVPLIGNNRVTLLIDVNIASAANLIIEPEVAMDGENYYVMTGRTTTSSPRVGKLQVMIAQGDIGSGDQRVAVSLPVLADSVRFVTYVSAAVTTTLGIRCLTGTV